MYEVDNLLVIFPTMVNLKIIAFLQKLRVKNFWSFHFYFQVTIRTEILSSEHKKKQKRCQIMCLSDVNCQEQEPVKKIDSFASYRYKACRRKSSSFRDTNNGFFDLKNLHFLPCYQKKTEINQNFPKSKFGHWFDHCFVHEKFFVSLT